MPAQFVKYKKCKINFLLVSDVIPSASIHWKEHRPCTPQQHILKDVVWWDVVRSCCNTLLIRYCLNWWTNILAQSIEMHNGIFGVRHSSAFIRYNKERSADRLYMYDISILYWNFIVDCSVSTFWHYITDKGFLLILIGHCRRWWN